MARPWVTIDAAATSDGRLELRRRGERDFLITLDGLVLMNSVANRSEIVLGQRGCSHLRNRPAARVLVGGLGMGCTLRAVLDTLPADAEVVVAELNPVVLAWCCGPLAGLTGGAATDPRVSIEIVDVAERVHAAANDEHDRFAAIIFDLYRGPHFRTDRQNDPLYGSRAIARVRQALTPDGVFAVWGENHDEGFARRLEAGGFAVTTERPGRGGLRHVVFIARRRH
ncbi:MAG: spermidine synthase [Desulfuromonas sp.]|nr:spermidine synthase [Desulfuromonas sp.]